MAAFFTSLRPDVRKALAEYLRPKAGDMVLEWFKDASPCGEDACSVCAEAYLDIAVPGYDDCDPIFEVVFCPEDVLPEVVCDGCAGSYPDMRAMLGSFGSDAPDYGGAFDGINVYSDADPGL